jgi:hypothetical protein
MQETVIRVRKIPSPRAMVDALEGGKTHMRIRDKWVVEVKSRVGRVMGGRNKRVLKGLLNSKIGKLCHLLVS